MDRRIFGLETGHDVTCTLLGQRPGAAPVLAAADALRDPERLSPDEVARNLFRRAASRRGSSSGLLPNGARLWFDMGSQPEYATPECDNVLDLVAHDKAGERILEDLLADAGRRLREEGIAGDIYVLKYNADPAGHSYVCQENYLAGWRGEFGRLAGILIPFLVTRQIICGAARYCRPRAARSTASASAPTTSGRACPRRPSGPGR